MDIRRNEDDTSVSSVISAISSATLSAPIETDYILKIKSTNTVKFDAESKSRLSAYSAQVQEMETYYCSKRYVDIRHLANVMWEHAQEVVHYYHDEHKAAKANENKSSRSVGSESQARHRSLGSVLERVLAKPVEVAHFVTNTESKNSNLVSELDSIFQSAGRKVGIGSGLPRSAASTPKSLAQGAPIFVREIMEGVDEFYTKIYSEKRQFSKKTKFDHVKMIAERRMVIINSAFECLAKALSAAGLETATKLETVPAPLELLVKAVEKFLLTDVIVDEGENVATPTTAEKQLPQDFPRVVPPPDRQSSVDSSTSIGSSLVIPVSTRRRASVGDRKVEVKNMMEVSVLVLAEEKLVVKRDAVNSGTATGGEEKTQVVPIDMGILPDHPIDFGLVMSFGAIFFKVLEGRAMMMQMDTIFLFGISCFLIGYQLARSSVVNTEKIGNKSPKKHVTIVEHQSSPKKEEQGNGQTQCKDPSLVTSRRALLQRTDGQLSVRKEQSRKLIQASMRTIMVDPAEKKTNNGAEEKPVVPANTFPKFPEGAAIGSHLNCWSSPPSKNFQVRGPNYLKDKKKVPSADFLFPCRGCDLFLTDNPPVNIGRNQAILNGKLRDVPTFIINYRLPWGVFLSYHEIPKRFLPFLRRGNGHGDLSTPLPSMVDMPAAERVMCNFFLADSEEKDAIMKLVPVVVEGPWMVKRVVGGKPAIVGKKLPISYVYQPPENGLADYLEADLDIVSSAAARNILAVVRSYTQVLTIDLGYVVQGNKEDALPEQMMLGLRLHGLDPLSAELLPEFHDGSGMPESEDNAGSDTE